MQYLCLSCQPIIHHSSVHLSIHSYILQFICPSLHRSVNWKTNHLFVYPTITTILLSPSSNLSEYLYSLSAMIHQSCDSPSNPLSISLRRGGWGSFDQEGGRGAADRRDGKTDAGRARQTGGHHRGVIRVQGGINLSLSPEIKYIKMKKKS